MDKNQILSAIENQKENFSKSPLKYYKNRIKALKNLRENINLMKEEIFEALKKDLNKSEAESYMTEVGLVLSEISYMIKHCRKFCKIKAVNSPLAHFPSKSYNIPSPRGVVLIMSPWNYPFLLTIEPLVDAITAGNSVILKPSNRSPYTSKVVEKLVKNTFPPEQVTTILGGREEISYLLDQDFDYIFYTGSMQVGKIVMEKANKHFTPYTLEMGGKSPCIVDKTANIPLSAKRIVFGKFMNGGQTCVAPDYIYCDKSIKEELVNELKKQIVLQYTDTPLTNENYPKMINKGHFDNKIKLIDNQKLIFGGKFDENQLKIEPTILDATFEDEIMQEEIFAPILPIVTFDSIDEAIKKINSGWTPLALYIFSSSKEIQNKVLNECQFGGGCVNDTLIHISSPYLPFGGLKQSGVGSYHGKAGFDTFTHYKNVLNKKTWLDLPMRYLPYTKTNYNLIKKFLK